MNGYRHGGRRSAGPTEYGRAMGQGPQGISPGRVTGPFVWLLVTAALAVWSLLAWGAYGLADGLLGWSVANSGALIDSGRGLADAAGVGQPVGKAADALNLGGLAEQGLGLLQSLLGPAIIALWAIGAVLLLAAPWLLSRIGGLAGVSRRIGR